VNGSSAGTGADVLKRRIFMLRFGCPKTILYK
jgi:hypothetical protein